MLHNVGRGTVQLVEVVDAWSLVEGVVPGLVIDLAGEHGCRA